VSQLLPRPSSGSILTGAASVPGGTAGTPAWFYIVAGAATGGGSALLYNDTACTAGREVVLLRATANEQGPQVGPFFATCTLYLGPVSSGSVVVWTGP